MIFPSVSVVMSVYNTDKYLKEAIESVLFQTYRDFEFIIVNDGSTDQSLKIINSFNDSRITVVDQKNTGLSKALNRGIAIARGELIIRMDADDICMPTRFEEQIKFMFINPGCVASGTNAIYLDKNGTELYYSDQLLGWDDIKSILPRSPFFHSSVIFRKDVFNKCGGYLEEIKQNFEDRILWNRMAKYGELKNIKNPLIKYRIVPNSISNISKKHNSILNNICNRIIETGSLNLSDKMLLENIISRSSYSNKMSTYYLRVGKIFLEYKFNRIKAFENLIISIRYSPLEKMAWFNLLLCFLPEKLIKKWKKSRGVQID